MMLEVTEPEDGAWVATLLSLDGPWTEALGRMVGAIGLAAVYGIALGARDGGMALATHPLGVAAAFVGVLVLGMPALFIVTSIFDVPIDAGQMARCAGRGAAAAGLTLAGLAPTAALFVVTSESAMAAEVVAASGLAIAGIIGMRHLHTAWDQVLDDAPLTKRSLAMTAFIVFVAFAGLLSTRIWMSTLPILGGAWW